MSILIKTYMKEGILLSTLKKIVIALTVLVIGIPATAFGYFYFKLNSINENNSDTDEILNNSKYEQVKGITNILLVGIDARDISQPSRSDAMMLLTLDTVHKSIKLTSFARDSYVEIPGHGSEKLTHAYAYGGINLLLETIENNFEVDINDYAIVNFFGFTDIIDTLGGVEIDVKQNEINELNTYIVNGQSIDKVAEGEQVKTITEPGVQTLNGYQALAYARIRYNDSAFGRDNRQRDIIEATLQKMSSVSIFKFNQILDSILPSLKTNMNPSRILKLGTTVLSINNFNIKQLEFPIPYEPYSNGGILDNKGWVLQFDSDKNLPILHDFIFNDIQFNEVED